MSKMQLQKVVIFCGVLTLILGLLDLSFKYGASSVKIDQIGKINSIANHELDPEIAIFGSSVSDVGIDANLLSNRTHLSCYNFSLNGTSFYQYRGLIDEFSNYSRKNSVIILAEAYFSFSKRDAIMSPDLYLAQLNNSRISDPLSTIDNELVWKLKYVPFYRFIAASHIYYKYSIHGLLNRIRSKNEIAQLNGFSPVYRSWEIDADEAIQNEGKFKIEIDEDVLKLYINQIRSLQQKGKKVIVVLTPIYKKAMEMATDLSPLYKTLKRISIETKVPCLDFTSSDLTKDKTLFYNSNHLNYTGAEKFSLILSDSLNRILKLN